MAKRKNKTHRDQHGFVLDLHGKRVAEALHVLDLELNAQFMRGGNGGRIICGHGTGALMSAVEQALLRHPLVANHARAEIGGSLTFSLHERHRHTYDDLA